MKPDSDGRSHIYARSLADIRAGARIDAAERPFLDTLGFFPCYPVPFPLLDRDVWSSIQQSDIREAFLDGGFL